MEEILEGLNIADDLKVQLLNEFNNAVTAKAMELAESKESDYEEYMMTQITEVKEDLEKKLDSYLDLVVEDFVEDNKIAIEENINAERYNAVLEGFSSVLVTAGTDIANIVENVEAGKEDNNVNESEKIDTLASKVIYLKAENAELLKMGLIKESTEGMTQMKKEKFEKLSTLVEFDSNNVEDYINKLDVLKESVESEETGFKKLEGAEPVKEIKEEAEETVYVSKARHLY